MSPLLQHLGLSRSLFAIQAGQSQQSLVPDLTLAVIEEFHQGRYRLSTDVHAQQRAIRERIATWGSLTR